MKVFYEVVDTIEEELNAHPFVNTVTYGNIFDVDLNKTTLFPLSHFIVNNATYQGNIWVLNISLLCMGITEGGDNEHYVLNEQMSVINKLFEKLRRGDLHDIPYKLDGNPISIPFKERFENDLIGWETTFNVQVANYMSNE